MKKKRKSYKGCEYGYNRRARKDNANNRSRKHQRVHE
jgi:hypothetical protein